MVTVCGEMSMSDLKVIALSAVIFLSMTCTSASAYEKQISELAAQMSETIANSNKKVVAVVDFTDLEGRTTRLGRFLAEEFSVALASKAKGFQVVDRTHVRVLLAEHKLASTGIIDPATARKLGKIAGVDLLITGTLTAFGESVRCTLKGLDTETALILSAATADIPRTKVISDLEGQQISAPGQPPGSAEGAAPRRVHSASSETVKPQVRSFKDITFQLSSCNRKLDSVECGVLIQSKEKPYEWFLIVGSGYDPFSRALDGLGKQYIALVSPGGSSRAYGQLQTRLWPDSPVSVVLTFHGVGKGITEFRFVTVVFVTGGGWNFYQITFSEVPIAQ